MDLDSTLDNQGESNLDSTKTESDVGSLLKPSTMPKDSNLEEEPEVQIDTVQFANVLSTATVAMAHSISEAHYDGLKEFVQNQEIVLESLQNENSKFESSEMLRSLDGLILKGKSYQTKLVRLKKTMSDIKTRTDNLKKTTEKLKLQKEKMAISREEARRREIERESLLVAQPAQPV